MAVEAENLAFGRHRPFKGCAEFIAQWTEPGDVFHAKADAVELMLEALLEVAEQKLFDCQLTPMKMTITSTKLRRKRVPKG